MSVLAVARVRRSRPARPKRRQDAESEGGRSEERARCPLRTSGERTPQARYVPQQRRVASRDGTSRRMRRPSRPRGVPGTGGKTQRPCPRPQGSGTPRAAEDPHGRPYMVRDDAGIGLIRGEPSRRNGDALELGRLYTT